MHIFSLEYSLEEKACFLGVVLRSGTLTDTSMGSSVVKTTPISNEVFVCCFEVPFEAIRMTYFESRMCGDGSSLIWSFCLRSKIYK